MRSFLLRFALATTCLVGFLGAPNLAESAMGGPNADEYVVKAERIYVLDRVDFVEDAWLHVVDGRIQKIGTGAVPQGVRLVDLGGASIMPGLVSVKSRLFVGRDTDGLGALYVSGDKFNPFANFQRTWRYGITVGRLHPPADRFVAGVGSVVRFGGNPQTASVLQRHHDLVLNFNDEGGRGESPYGEIRTPTSLDVPNVPADRRRPATRLGRIAALDNMIRDAKNQDREGFDRLNFDRRLAAFGQFIASDRPFFADARRENDIRQALRAIEKNKRSGILYGVDEGHLCIETLAKAQRPVVVEVDNDLLRLTGGTWDPIAPVRTEYATAARLEAAGIPVVIGGRTDDLLLAAALAVKGGMKEASALRAITRRPAALLGIGDRAGRIAVGRDADFIVLNGEPLATSTSVQQVWVGGQAAWDIDVHGAGKRKAKKREALIVTAGLVHDGLGGVYENGAVLIENGKVVACGKSVPHPRYAKFHDAGPDAVITPGFIDVHGHLGLGSENTSPKPDSSFAELFKVARGPFAQVANAGVTTVVVAPRRASTSGVQMTAIKTAQPGDQDLVAKSLAGLKITVAGRTEAVARRNLEGLLKRAQAYDKKWTDYEAALAAFEAQKKSGKAPVAAPKPVAKPVAKPASGKGDVLSGTWATKLSGGPIPDVVTVNMSLALDGNSVAGTIADPFGSGEDALIRGTLSGKSLTAEIEIEDSPFGNPTLTATLDKAEHLKGQIDIGGLIQIELDASRTSKGRPKITVSRKKTAGAVAASGPKGPKKPKKDSKLEPFRAVLAGKAGLSLVANGEEALSAATSVFAKNKIPVVIIGGLGIEEILEDLPAADLVGVSVGTRFLRVKDGQEILVPDELDRAGVAPLFASSATWEASRLPRVVTGVVRTGFDADQALRSLTSDAARLLRLDDTVGSLRPGLDGDFLIFDGDPFDVRSTLQSVFIRGQEVNR